MQEQEPTPEPEPTPQAEPEPEPVTVAMCSACGKEAEPEYVAFTKQKTGKVMCKACFEALSRAPKTETGPAPVEAKNHCKSCGKEILPGATSCLDCVSAEHGKVQAKVEPVQAPAPVADGLYGICTNCGAPLTKGDKNACNLFFTSGITSLCKPCIEMKQRGEI